MMKDAESHAGEDDETKEADRSAKPSGRLVYSVEKTFSENKDKLDAAAAGELETAIAESKTALGGERCGRDEQRVRTSANRFAQTGGSSLQPNPGGPSAGGADAAGGGAEEQASASSASAGADSSAPTGGRQCHRRRIC